MPLTAGSQIKDYHAVAGSEPDPDWYLALQDANEGTPANAVIAVQAQGLYKAAYKAATEKTVSSGVLTVDQNSHKIQPQTGTSDDIVTISGMKADTFLVLFATDEGTDTLTFKHGSDNLSCFGASDVELSHGMVVCYYDGSVVYVAGGGGGEGGMSSQNDTVIGSNITLVEATIHNQTIAGLTANRQNIFPVPSAVNKEITINILDGDADYVMIPIGAATVTLNGGSAATALDSHRLFIANESLTWISTSLTNWQLIVDGRISVKTSMYDDNGTAWNSGVNTTPSFSTLSQDDGEAGDLSNDRINIRRAGLYNYNLTAASAADVTASGPYSCSTVIKNSSAATKISTRHTVLSSNSRVIIAEAGQMALVLSDAWVIPTYTQSSGEDSFFLNTNTGAVFTLSEILP